MRELRNINRPADSTAVFTARFISLSPYPFGRPTGRPTPYAAIVKPAAGIVKSEKLRSGIAKADIAAVAARIAAAHAVHSHAATTAHFV